MVTIEQIDAGITRHSAELVAQCRLIDEGKDPAHTAFYRTEFLHGYLAALRHVRYAMTHNDWTLA